MPPHRRSPQAEDDLDEIWLFVARESGSLSAADRLVDSITDYFHLLSRQPHLGRSRALELGPGTRSFPVGKYLILYRVRAEEVLILRVIHGARDLGQTVGV